MALCAAAAQDGHAGAQADVAAQQAIAGGRSPLLAVSQHFVQDVATLGTMSLLVFLIRWIRRPASTDVLCSSSLFKQLGLFWICLLQTGLSRMMHHKNLSSARHRTMQQYGNKSEDARTVEAEVALFTW